MTTNWHTNSALAEPPMRADTPTTAAILGRRTRPLISAASLGLGDQCWHRALRAAGLGNLMDSTAVKLFLVPSDRAFVDLLHELQLSWSALCDDQARLRSLLLGHVVLDDGEFDLYRAGGLLRTTNQGIVQLRGQGRLRDAHGRQAELLMPLPEGQGRKAPGFLIDRVLRPAEQGLLELLAAHPEHSDFLAALRQTGVSSCLAGGGPFTVLAPDNAGWAAHLAHLQLNSHNGPAHATAALKSLVSRHLLAGRWLSDELPWGGALQNLNDEALRLSPLGLLGDGPCSQALLSGSDKLARNGVLHRLAKPLPPHH